MKRSRISVLLTILAAVLFSAASVGASLLLFRDKRSQREKNTEISIPSDPAHTDGPDESTVPGTDNPSDAPAPFECGTAGHCCKNENEHVYLCRAIAKGCLYCGRSDCPALFEQNASGHYTFLCKSCPEYNEALDSTLICDHCGRRKTSLSFPYPDKGCTRFVKDAFCPYCNQPVGPGVCHSCPEGTTIKEN